MCTEIGTGIPDEISELWTPKSMISPRALLTRPFDLADQQCEYAKDQALTVNVLWEVAYGICHEALHLNSLEDFNATEADLMGMKNDILAMWKSRDRRRTSSLRPTFISSSVDSKEQGSTLGKTFIPGRAATSISAPHGPSDSMGEASLPFFRPLAPPPGIPSMSGLSPYNERAFAHKFSCGGNTHGV